jgi:hypothetical protein
MSVLTVNEALDQGWLRNGQCMEIQGVLALEEENAGYNAVLCHWPKSERRSQKISVETEGVFQFNLEILWRWRDKRVIVFGEWEMAEPSRHDGPRIEYGHMGMCPARIKARRIDLLKERNRSENHPPL